MAPVTDIFLYMTYTVYIGLEMIVGVAKTKKNCSATKICGFFEPQTVI